MTLFLKKLFFTKRAALCVALFSVLAFTIWVVPVIISNNKAQPYQGAFWVNRCLCNHDIFLRIEGDKLYDYCPGHGQDQLIGCVVKHPDDYLILFETNPKYPVIIYASKLKYKDGRHYLLRSYKGARWQPIEQINNPWRTDQRIVDWRESLPW